MKIDTDCGKTRGAGNLFQHFTTRTGRHRSWDEDGLVLAVIGRCALVVQLGWAEEEVGRVKVNFTFENVEGQDEVSSETSVFQREEVELAKPFLM